MPGEDYRGGCSAAKRSSRAFTRQLTFVDIERSFATAGEDGTPADLHSDSSGDHGYSNGHSVGHTNGISEDTRKVAIVIEATSTIGTALAKHLLAQNFRVALTDHHTSSGQALATHLNDYNAAQFFPCDIASYASQAAMFRAVWQTWQRTDLCCLSSETAGSFDQSGSVYINKHQGKEVEDVPREPNSATTNVCCKSLLYGTLLATHFMRFNGDAEREGGGGRILVSATVQGSATRAACVESCGAEASVVQFVRSVAPGLKQQQNVLMNVVLSGTASTPNMPAETIEAIGPECRTSVSTVLAAHDLFINDETNQVGKVLEALANRLVFRDPLEYCHKQAVTEWEPLLRAKHGEDPGLANAIK